MWPKRRLISYHRFALKKFSSFAGMEYGNNTGGESKDIFVVDRVVISNNLIDQTALGTCCLSDESNKKRKIKSGN